MIPPVLAASAASAALGVVSSLASDAASDASSAGSSAAAQAERNDVIGQQDFLTLLVTQLQNQDPLNPLDSAQFSAQLAQFSSLEQLTQINQKLTEMLDANDAPPALDPVGLLGREVTATGSSVVVQGGEASELEFELASAGSVTVEVRDAAGNLVASTTLADQAAGTHMLDLDATSGIGSLADGTYQVKLTVSGSALETRISGTVTGVDLQSDPPVLTVGGIEIPLANVREVRTADGGTA
jgi:flagellar basal-body rod modification protein FlgD